MRVEDLLVAVTGDAATEELGHELRPLLALDRSCPLHRREPVAGVTLDIGRRMKPSLTGLTKAKVHVRPDLPLALLLELAQPVDPACIRVERPGPAQCVAGKDTRHDLLRIK